ncbi:hypothetical protein [Undibacterium rugosum]|uniref:hypothetical protein n=1 Tax=Undibacterium rugosum TaxID=2762291 RepID=UPI001B825B9E|nr:hypothetical protein [Undibacterium rugosum]MBR7776978.1 hypothetical protein [Undibacterium rugosum]
MSDQKTVLIVELAKELIEMIQQVAPSWKKVYFRYCHEEFKAGSNGSYVVDSKVLLIDPFKQDDFFRSMNEKSAHLLALLEKKQAVLLLVADSDFNYDIKFEYENLDRWRISKVKGATGVPDGL